MSDKPENPQAFPQYPGDTWEWATGKGEGMTLRDWFAGQALMSVMAADCYGQGFSSERDYHARMAELSYSLADAMLSEREKRNDG